tara:strand:+ start:102 stop:3011 length:2910 start_codon:yes stop_codon:yes gene_type:complete
MAIRRPPTTFSDEISAADLAANSVTASELADDAVDTAALADGAVDADRLATNAVTTVKIANDAVDADKLASNAVVSASIVDANITAAKLAASAIEVNPHIKPGTLYPAIGGKDVTGTALGGSYTYGSAHTDGRKYYYTDIKGSKPIKDPRIGAHFGSQRHMFKSMQLLTEETSGHGAEVYSIDGREWLRTYSSTAKNLVVENGSLGVNLLGTTDCAGITLEIVGYFNNFNLICRNAANQCDDVGVTINGGTERDSADTAKLFGRTAQTSPLGSRYVSSGSVINHGDSNVTSDLGAAPAIQTLKIQAKTGSSEYLYIYGIELISQDTASATRKQHVIIPSQNVVSYGKKFTVGSDTMTNAVHKHYNPFAFKTDGTTAWASGANNGTSWPVGTGSSHNIDTATSLGLEKWKSGTDYYKPYNGGRVVKWVDSSGNIKTSVTVMPPNAKSYADSASPGGAGTTKANAAAANDTALPTFEVNTGGATDVDEDGLSEVATTFYNREFGNGAANGAGGTYADFSMAVENAGDELAYVMDDGLTSLYGDIRCADLNKPMQNAAGDSTYWTFIGTGFSMQQSDVTTDFNFAQSLPYGTHVVRYRRDSTTGNSTMLVDGVILWTGWSRWAEITIHQPKRPPIPEDAVVLADYMLMADHIVQADAEQTQISKGVRLCSGSRDHLCDGDGVFTGGAHQMCSGVASPMGGMRGFAAVSSGNSTAKLPFFGTNAQVNVQDSTNAGFAISLGGTGKTEVRLDCSDGTFGDQIVIADSEKVELGMTDVTTVVPANGMTFFGSLVATPTHTSHHYQPFEDPYLKDLVGGDRNMEQTNLIVTPDGKSWDEVTRDTSYIGNGRVSSCSESDTWIMNNDPAIFDEIRGGDSTSLGAARYNKDFAVASDRYYCLKDGNYKVGFRFLQKNGDHVYIRLNGANVGGSHYQTNSGDYSTVNLTENLQLKRGDYIEVYDLYHGGLWSHFYIEQI